MMEFSDMLNIGKKNIENIIKDSISSVKRELDGLDNNQTCMIYSSYIYIFLKSKHVLCYIFDTYEDLKMNYQHRFVMVYDGNKKYIIDLTYDQFGFDERFSDIYSKGYQMIDDDMYLGYLNNIGRVKRER